MFEDLHEDILVHILASCDLPTLTSCELVCTSLCTVVQRNPHVAFRRGCLALGYEPLQVVQRTSDALGLGLGGAGVEERLEALRRHEEGWARFGPTFSHELRIHTAAASPSPSHSTRASARTLGTGVQQRSLTMSDAYLYLVEHHHRDLDPERTLNSERGWFEIERVDLEDGAVDEEWIRVPVPVPAPAPAPAPVLLSSSSSLGLQDAYDFDFGGGYAGHKLVVDEEEDILLLLHWQTYLNPPRTVLSIDCFAPSTTARHPSAAAGGPALLDVGPGLCVDVDGAVTLHDLVLCCTLVRGFGPGRGSSGGGDGDGGEGGTRVLLVNLRIGAHILIRTGLDSSESESGLNTSASAGRGRAVLLSDAQVLVAMPARLEVWSFTFACHPDQSEPEYQGKTRAWRTHTLLLPPFLPTPIYRVTFAQTRAPSVVRWSCVCGSGSGSGCGSGRGCGVGEGAGAVASVSALALASASAVAFEARALAVAFEAESDLDSDSDSVVLFVDLPALRRYLWKHGSGSGSGDGDGDRDRDERTDRARPWAEWTAGVPVTTARLRHPSGSRPPSLYSPSSSSTGIASASSPIPSTAESESGSAPPNAKPHGAHWHWQMSMVGRRLVCVCAPAVANKGTGDMDAGTGMGMSIFEIGLGSARGGPLQIVPGAGKDRSRLPVSLVQVDGGDVQWGTGTGTETETGTRVR